MFSTWHELCIRGFIDFENDGGMRHHLTEWMQEMTTELKSLIAPVVLMAVLASATATADDKGLTEQKKEAAAAGKMLADTAITTAVEDAIKAVLVDNKLELDIHFNDRTSQITVDGP